MLYFFRWLEVVYKNVQVRFLLVTNKYFEKIAQVLFDSDEAFLHVGAQQERVHQSGLDQLLMVSGSDTVWTFGRKPPQSSLSNEIMMSLPYKKEVYPSLLLLYFFESMFSYKYT